MCDSHISFSSQPIVQMARLWHSEWIRSVGSCKAQKPTPPRAIIQGWARRPRDMGACTTSAKYSEFWTLPGPQSAHICSIKSTQPPLLYMLFNHLPLSSADVIC